MRVVSTWVSTLDFYNKVHDKAGRFGHSSGTSSSVIDATSSPHYQRRTSLSGRMTEAAALDLVRSSDATGRRILDKGHSVVEGQPVGVRANLNVKKTTGITVQTMHAGTQAQLLKRTGMFSGEALGYGAVVTLRNVNFSVNQTARHNIATGQSNKYPMASVDGNFHKPSATDRTVFDGVELRFNPVRGHLFTDPSGRAVRSASEATVVGSQVFVRGKIEYYTPQNIPKPVGDVPSDSHA